jgi:hypothetical protein
MNSKAFEFDEFCSPHAQFHSAAGQQARATSTQIMVSQAMETSINLTFLKLLTTIYTVLPTFRLSFKTVEETGT